MHEVQAPGEGEKGDAIALDVLTCAIKPCILPRMMYTFRQIKMSMWSLLWSRRRGACRRRWRFPRA